MWLDNEMRVEEPAYNLCVPFCLPLTIMHAQNCPQWGQHKAELPANPQCTTSVALPVGKKQLQGCHLDLPNQPNARHLGEQKIKPHVDEDTEAQRKKVHTLAFPARESHPAWIFLSLKEEDLARWSSTKLFKVHQITYTDKLTARCYHRRKLGEESTGFLE